MNIDKYSRNASRETQLTPGSELPRINSADLFRGTRRIIIVHGNEEYRLQQTSTGKLILTK